VLCVRLFLNVTLAYPHRHHPRSETAFDWIDRDDGPISIAREDLKLTLPQDVVLLGLLISLPICTQPRGKVLWIFL
jgi:hypothetical protein